MKKRHTIKDVALLANVSTATVSHILNGKRDRVSQETIEKVEKIIKETGYVKSNSALAFKGKGSKLIGVIIPSLITKNKKMIFENTFYSEFISGIEYALRTRGYGLVLNVYTGQDEFKEICLGWNLDGVIALGADEEEICEMLSEFKLDILFVDSYNKIEGAYYLNIDDFNSSYALTQYLISRGQKNFSFVTGTLADNGVIRKRLEGYKKALFDSNLKYDPQLVIEGDVTFNHGESSAKKILSIDSSVDCVIASADILALGLNAGFSNLGVSVPNDMSIAGFDNTYLSKIMQPALTTIDQNILKRGEIAGETIIRMIEHMQEKKEIITGYELKVRQSTL